VVASDRLVSGRRTTKVGISIAFHSEANFGRPGLGGQLCPPAYRPFAQTTARRPTDHPSHLFPSACPRSSSANVESASPNRIRLRPRSPPLSHRSLRPRLQRSRSRPPTVATPAMASGPPGMPHRRRLPTARRLPKAGKVLPSRAGSLRPTAASAASASVSRAMLPGALWTPRCVLSERRAASAPAASPPPG